MAYFVPCHEQQNTAEKTNRHKLVLSRCHVMNSRSLLRRPTGPQAGIVRCHVMNSRALLRKPRGAQDSWCIPGAFLVHSWCTPGALLVHSWCTPGSLLVHFWCTPGALLVHSWCTLGALLVHSWCTPRCTPKVSLERELHSLPKVQLLVHSWSETSRIALFAKVTNPKGNCFASERKPRSSVQKRLDRLFANLQTRKGNAPLPKGSLDPPHRNVWIAFSPICKPERELHRFRKEVSILRTETFGSPSRQLANPKGKLHRFRKEASILRTETFGSPKTLPIHHRKRRNHEQAAAEYLSDAPNREVDERAWGPSGTKSCWNLSLREDSDVYTENCICGT